MRQNIRYAGLAALALVAGASAVIAGASPAAAFDYPYCLQGKQHLGGIVPVVAVAQRLLARAVLRQVGFEVLGALRSTAGPAACVPSTSASTWPRPSWPGWAGGLAAVRACRGANGLYT